jgi:unsaturated rhamnogalacturonyl hydrolase
VVKLIGDKLVRDTPFKYRLTLSENNPQLNGLHFVDFGRTFGTTQPAVAYAYTQLTLNTDTQMTLQTAHNDGCKIWVNNELVYEKRGKHRLELKFEERSVEMENQFTISLKKGENSLLIKSETYGNEWVVYLQPPSLKGAVVSETVEYPEIGLKSVPNVDSKITQLTNWLVIGPFANTDGKGMTRLTNLKKRLYLVKCTRVPIHPSPGQFQKLKFWAI